ncbi:MAG: cobalamin B12-binding domain-containing protein [Thermotogota bacterium]
MDENILVKNQDRIIKKTLKIFKEKNIKVSGQKDIDDMIYHLKYLDLTVDYGEPRIFTNYFEWLRDVFISYNLSVHELIRSLYALSEAISLLLENDYGGKIYSIIDSTIQNSINDRLKIEDKERDNLEKIYLDNDLYSFYNKYLEAILNLDKEEAFEVVDKIREKGYKAKEIYLNIFQMALHKLGELWQKNMISVAQEHYGTAITRRAMEKFNLNIKTYKDNSPVFLGVCPPNDNHEVGLRMICDFLESDGWKTIFIGSSSTISSVLDILKNHTVDVLGISISLSIYLKDAQKMINMVKKEFPDVKILVGGNAIRGNERIVDKLGADGTAYDANEIIPITNKLIKK